MENFHDLLINRRSYRRYTEETIDAESVRLIVEAALMSPSSKSTRAWQLIVVEDKETLEQLSQCKAAGALPIKNSVLSIIVSVDPTISEAWVEDASIAAAFMQLQAADLGLGSCWIQVRNRFTADGVPAEEVVQNILGMPETMPVECIITFGHKNEERKPNDTEKLRWDQVHIGKW